MFNLLLLFQISFGQEIILSKKTYKDANISEILQSQSLFKCPLELQNQEFTLNNSKVICEQSDLLYTMKINLAKENENFEMFIDLVGPWSWYKSSECEFYDQPQINQTIQKNSCFEKNYIKSQKLEQQSSIESQIIAHNFSLKGFLVTSNVQIDGKQFELQMLQVNNIYAKRSYLSDGAISLSHFNGSGQQNFIIQYSQSNKSILQFDLYTQKQTIAIRNEILQRPNYQLHWINNSDINKPQWKFIIDQISLMNKPLSDKDQQYQAILTLNSQYISLPLELSNQLIDQLTKYDNGISCVYADSELFVIVCKNMSQSLTKSLSINLKISDLQINLNNLLGNCKKDEQFKNKCQLKIKLSSSNTIFLGEPFFIDKRILLNYQTGQIGVYKEIIDQKSQNKDALAFENLGIWVIILTILLILIFCLMNIKHAFKWFIRAIRYRKTQNFDDEQQLRSKEIEFNEMEKAEQMTQSIEENSI
ncbi:unnamed protein product [Paramecium pentaurelia]|uniref:Peptidase A1 domain-containing protein n=1 Tax=Paramecium pentaurelia TaxID=43138 RepID=A0A8S1S3W1_9CILI|nr:unnamed protein product [Paramecium pentaurelia]